MDIITIIKFANDLGLLNILGLLVIVNSPGVCISLYYNLSKRYVPRTYFDNIVKSYITRQEYNKDIKVLYRDVLGPLKDEIGKLNELIDSLANVLNDHKTTMAVHEEKIKAFTNENKYP